MKDATLLVFRADADESDHAVIVEDVRAFEVSEYSGLLEHWLRAADIVIDLSAEDGEWPDARVTKWEGQVLYD